MLGAPGLAFETWDTSKAHSQRVSAQRYTLRKNSWEARNASPHDFHCEGFGTGKKRVRARLQSCRKCRKIEVGFSPCGHSRNLQQSRVSAEAYPSLLHRKQEGSIQQMAATRKYKVGLVQMSMGPDPDANFAAAIEHVREAARRGAQIVCLPELFRAQYFCQREDTRLFDLAEPIPGPSTTKLSELAK